MSIQSELSEANRHIAAAIEDTSCGWCAGNLKALHSVIGDMIVVTPFTDEAAKRVRAQGEEQIRRIGGKVGVLKSIVQETQTSVGPEQVINNPISHHSLRGIPMDKKTVMYTVGSQLALGALGGFVMNRVDEWWVADRTKQGLATAWYEKLGPWVNVGVGVVLVGLGAMGKVFKTPNTQLVAVVGGGAMLQNGVLNLLEGVYASMQVPAGRPAAKAYYPVSARMPGMIPPRSIEIDSF